MKNNNAEEMLLNNTSLDELIKMRIEKEFMDDLKKSKEKPEKKEYTNIKDLPRGKIFSKDAVFRCYCKKTKCESFINGIQAEALIGLQDNIREQMLNGEVSAFATDDAYIKFEKAVF